MDSWAFSAAQNRAFALRVEPLASLNRHAADYQSLTRRHALRVSSLVGDAGEPEYRFSEREGWHLGTPTPRPQETGWHSLRPQGPRRRLGVCRCGWHWPTPRPHSWHSLHLFPRSWRCRQATGHPPPSCRLPPPRWGGCPVALLHQWDAGQVVACSVVAL